MEFRLIEAYITENIMMIIMIKIFCNTMQHLQVQNLDKQYLFPRRLTCSPQSYTSNSKSLVGCLNIYL